MPCVPFDNGKGGRGFMCGPGLKRKPCACGSGLPASLLCDWKVKGNETGTCDAPLCRRCAHVPAPKKDLCPHHAAEWKARQK